MIVRLVYMYMGWSMESVYIYDFTYVTLKFLDRKKSDILNGYLNAPQYSEL